jgi:7-cyano-7-deazaguanine synthase in queuosine biosynthesis
VAVRNPLPYQTKGQARAIAYNNGLSETVLAQTVSCRNYSAHHLTGNCGYCYHFLISRSGLHAALGEDPTLRM